MAEYVAKGPGVTVVVDTAPIERHTKAVMDGAVADFTAGATEVLTRVQTGAMARWPVATGRSRDSFVVRSEVGQRRVSVVIANKQSYTYKMHWSRYTVQQVDELKRKAVPVEAAVARGNSPAAQAKIRKWAASRDPVKRHGTGAPSAALAGKRPWQVLVQRPAEDAKTAFAGRMQAQLLILAKRAT